MEDYNSEVYVPLNAIISPSFVLNIASIFGSLHNSGSSSAGGGGRNPRGDLVFVPYRA